MNNNDVKEFLEKNSSDWQKALFFALMIRRAYLNLTKTLPSHTTDLRSYPTSKTLAILRDPEDNQFDVTPEHKGMEFIRRYSSYYTPQHLREIKRALDVFRRTLTQANRLKNSSNIEICNIAKPFEGYIDSLRIWSHGRNSTLPSFTLSEQFGDIKNYILERWPEGTNESKDRQWGLVCPYDYAVKYSKRLGEDVLNLWFFCGGRKDVLAALPSDPEKITESIGNIDDSAQAISQHLEEFAGTYGVSTENLNN